jgi:hypothetical protein
MKFPTTELFLGVFLTVAVFAMGMMFASSVFSPDAKPETAAQEHSKQEAPKASTDERIADYTWWLAVLTGGLVFVAIGQGVFIARSDKTARIAADASNRTAAAANISAITARDAFTKSERPYLYVFGVSEISFDPRDTDSIARVQFSIANYGKTPAKIELPCAGMTNFGNSPEIPIMVDMRHDLLTSPIVAPNERRDNLSIDFPTGIDIDRVDDDDYPPGDIWIPRLEGQNDFFFWVVVKYCGPFTIGHETSACWRWDRTTNSLIQHGGEDYNYTR